MSVKISDQPEPQELKIVEALSGQEKQGLIYGMRLLKIAKRSEASMRTRLLDKGYSEQAICKVIQILKQQKYIDDLDLAQNLVYWANHGKPMGRKKIWFELKRKGIPEAVIATALNEQDIDNEQKLAEELAHERYEKIKFGELFARRKRVYDFLIRRGFDYEVSRQVVSKLGSHENR